MNSPVASQGEMFGVLFQSRIRCVSGALSNLTLWKIWCHAWRSSQIQAALWCRALLKLFMFWTGIIIGIKIKPLNPHRTGKVHFMWPKFVLNFKSGVCAGKLNKTATLFYEEGLSNAQHVSASQMSSSGLNQQLHHLYPAPPSLWVQKPNKPRVTSPQLRKFAVAPMA